MTDDRLALIESNITEGYPVTLDVARELMYEVMRLREGAAKLAKVEKAIRDYHYVVDCLRNTEISAPATVSAVERAMGMPWEPGAETERRKGGACS